MDIFPPNGPEIERQIGSRLENVDVGAEMQAQIEWREQKRTVPVLPLPLDLLYFNPNTRRIRAQLTVDPSRYSALQAEPFSDGAQAYLRDLLKWDPASPGKIDPSFERLKEDLKEFGQDEEGIVTRQGVLINGNTRAVALKELGKKHIRVAVLPSDATLADIEALELSLQLRKTHKREYSFVNGLMAIREEKDRKTPKEQILRAFRMKTDRYERSLWLYDFIQEAVSRSAVVHDGKTHSVATYYFERDQGQLEELYRDWKKLHEQDPEKAALLRESRLLGVIMQRAKTDLRVMDGNFFETYVLPTLPAELRPDVAAATPKRLPGLTDVVVDEESPALLQVKALTDRALKAEALRRSSDGDATSPSEQDFLKRLGDVYLNASRRAGADKDLRQKALGPAGRVKVAADALEDAARAAQDSRTSGSLDISELEDALEQLRRSVILLAQEGSRLPDDEKDIGFAWLKASANLEFGNNGD